MNNQISSNFFKFELNKQIWKYAVSFKTADNQPALAETEDY